MEYHFLTPKYTPPTGAGTIWLRISCTVHFDLRITDSAGGTPSPAEFTDPVSTESAPVSADQPYRSPSAASLARKKRQGRAEATPLSVVIAGHVCIDSNVVDGNATTSPGSPAYFIAGALRGLPGITTTVIAPHGADFDELAPSLQIATPRHNRGSLHFENVITGAVRQQRATGLDGAVPSALTRAEKAALARADILLIAPLVDEFSARYVASLVDATAPHALIVLLPQGYLRRVDGDGAITPSISAELAAVSSEAAVIVFSDDDSSDPEVLAWRLAEGDNRPKVVITRAENGATVITDIDSIDVPTTPIPTEHIVNPVGAGDVFSAAVAVALRRGAPIEEAVRFGHVTAARHVSGQVPAQNAPRLER